jgi:Tfp pilus assembly protein PilV
MSEKRITTNPRRKRIRPGLTFTEVLVATLILSLAMVPVLKALTNSHLYSQMLERKTQCLILAQNAIEELRARAIENFDSSWSVSNQSAGGGYLLSISAGSESALRTVAVTAGFDENQNGSLDGAEVLVCLRTLIAKQQ